MTSLERREATMKRREFISLVGGAVAWPLATGAEPIRNKYRLVILTPSALNRDYRPIKEFFNELARSGYVEGQNIIIEVFSTDGNSERRSEVAHAAVRGNPDVIFVFTGPFAQHVKDVTATIPIVCVTSDPIALGLTTSLARPSGNVSGVVVDAGIEGWGKKLQLLREVAPNTKRIGFLARQAVWEGTETPAVVRAIRAAAETLGFDLLGVPVASPMQEAEYRHAFETIIIEKIEGLVVQDAPEHLVYSELIVDLVAKAKIPAVYPYRSFANGLITYAVDEVELIRFAATQIVQRIKGKPIQEMPWYQPRSFQLILNTKAASAIGIEFPPALLANADEVIE
jgi:putative tryptophan/tyrosine transport system substrate-binding protein